MRKTNVFIIGNGSLGSFAALLLTKLAGNFNWKITLVDFDTVEQHNLENQLFRKEDIGKPKATALSELLRPLTEAEIDTAIKKADPKSRLCDIVVVLVDTMKARKEIFEACRYEAGVIRYLEARSDGDSALVYAIDPRDIDCVKRYESELYDDKEALPAPCATATQIPILFSVAAVIGALLIRHENQFPKTGEFIRVSIGSDGAYLPITASKFYTNFSH